MQKTLLAIAFLSATNIQSIEYQMMIDNNYVSVGRCKIFPGEVIGPYRVDYPQIVYALQGGIITHIEMDGRQTETIFPTAIMVYKAPDPENKMHKSVNNSDSVVDIINVQFKNISMISELKA